MTHPSPNQSLFEQSNPKLATKVNALVVEDDENSRVLITIYLESLGVTVTAVENGKLALAYLQQNKTDIIFTDIRMPELDGEALLTAVKNMPAFEKTPVIAVTASSMIHERKFFIKQGFDEFVAKPIDFKDLVNAIGKHLDVKWHPIS